MNLINNIIFFIEVDNYCLYNLMKHINFRCNVADETDWMSTWSHTENYFEGRIRLLVNNAGVNPHHGWKTCLDVMIYGVMMGSFIARDRMGKTKVRIYVLINISLQSHNFEILVLIGP